MKSYEYVSEVDTKFATEIKNTITAKGGTLAREIIDVIQELYHRVNNPQNIQVIYHAFLIRHLPNYEDILDDAQIAYFRKWVSSTLSNIIRDKSNNCYGLTKGPIRGTFVLKNLDVSAYKDKSVSDTALIIQLATPMAPERLKILHDLIGNLIRLKETA